MSFDAVMDMDRTKMAQQVAGKNGCRGEAARPGQASEKHAQNHADHSKRKGRNPQEVEVFPLYQGS